MYQKYIDAGFSVAPGTSDKKPTISWLPLQHRQPTASEIAEYPKSPYAYIIVCGEGSHNLEVMDFDEKYHRGIFKEWLALIPDEIKPSKFGLPLIQTKSGGYHIYYRLAHTDMVERNLKLSYNEEKGITIETRGQGGYVMAPPSPGYSVIRGSISNVPVIPVAVRDAYHDIARSLDKSPLSKGLISLEKRPLPPLDSKRPGDIFERTADWITDILAPAGWHSARQTARGAVLTRPGKKHGVSGEIRRYGDHEVFIVYSSSAAPFESEQYYTKFGAYALLKHNADFKEASRALMKENYLRLTKQ